MKIIVCKECGKVKKSKADPSHKRINGQKVLKQILKWLKKHPEHKSLIEVQSTSCMKQCKKSPNIFIKEERRFYHRLTKEALKSLLEAKVSKA